MSKPRDPVLAVLKYFESAELPLARQALALAQAIVNRRSPRAHPLVSKPRKRVVRSVDEENALKQLATPLV